MPAWLLAFLAMSPDAVVLSPVANMYSKPDLEADVTSQAIYAAPVRVEETEAGWVKIKTADDYAGWVPESTIRRLSAGERVYGSEGRVATIDNLMVHLYREASLTRHAPLLAVPYETRLEVVAEPEADERRWIQVRLPDDRAAWLQRGDVSFDPPVLNVVETIRLAKRFLGLPYTWGGTSSFGYDCSGYIQMLCRRRGRTMPRDAQPQAQWNGVTIVSREDLRTGDLVYFGKTPDRITHTGMYIGDGQFIHATAHDQPVIQISELNDPHWSAIHVGSRRLK